MILGVYGYERTSTGYGGEGGKPVLDFNNYQEGNEPEKNNTMDRYSANRATTLANENGQ
jgi:hypothetical protein